VLVTVEEDRRSGILTRRIVSFRRTSGDLYRRDQEIHRQRLIRGSELTGQLRKIGFRVRTMRGYGSWRFPPAVIGFLARKP
jgi:hypothetical protein